MLALRRTRCQIIITTIRRSILLTTLGYGGMVFETLGQEGRESLAGEKAAESLKSSIAAEQYNIRYGPLRFQTEARAGAGYTDNVFYSHKKESDWVVNPEIDLRALWPITQLNTLRLSLGVGYEWYANHSVLNSDKPLISPDSELVFNVFVGDFRIKLREKFSYAETLFINSVAGDSTRFFNFNDVGKFARLDNLAGLTVDWDLNKLILSAGYDHENFISTTERFKYLNRASELFSSSATFLIGDRAKVGVEGQGSWNDFERETTLNDNWRARVGPFADVGLPQGISFRAGGGYETARYDAAGKQSDFKTYYAYGRIRQETRLFTHSVTAGRETTPGDNANNLQTTYVRYSITSPVVAHVDLGANLSVNFAEEFGGPFRENFTYYRAGLRVGYQFHKYWRTNLAYEFLSKDSDLALRDFDRNRVSWDVTFQF